MDLSSLNLAYCLGGYIVFGATLLGFLARK
jgi:hypothetical protein